MNDRRVLKALLASAMMPIPEGTLSLRYRRLLDARNAVVANRDNDETPNMVSALFAVLDADFPARPTDDQKPFAQELISEALLDFDKLDNWTDGQTSILEDLLVNVAVVRALVCNYRVRMDERDELLVWTVRNRDYLTNI